MRELYPEIEPYQQGHLKVSPLHEIYYEQSGNPERPARRLRARRAGGGTEPFQRRFFDPATYRIVLFDQRGAGKSRPHASLEDNTTWHLVGDMERLREELGIDRWVVFGGSWGSTLGLAYAETHPDRVRGPDPPRDLPRPAEGDRVVLPGGGELHLPRRLGGVPRAHPARGAGRHGRGVLPPADERRRGGARPGGARLERLGGVDQQAPPRPEADRPLREATTSPRPSRGSSATTSPTARSCATPTSCWTTSRGSGTSRASSSRAATTWCAP